MVDGGVLILLSGVRHLEEMESYAKIPPAVNQIEVSPARFPQWIPLLSGLSALQARFHTWLTVSKGLHLAW